MLEQQTHASAEEMPSLTLVASSQHTYKESAVAMFKILCYKADGNNVDRKKWKWCMQH